MKDIYEVIRQKETELQVVKLEVDALKIAVPLLEDGAVLETPQAAV